MLEEGKKVVSIHQPNYIPWLGYFYKVYKSDVFVFLDDAQFSNKGTQNYHYIKTPQGPLRLKIPVKQSLGDKIYDVTTKDELGWKQKHLRTIEMNYKKAAYFDEVFEDFSKLLNKEYPNIAVQNREVVQFISRKFGFTTKFVEASSFNINTVRTEKILDLCKVLNASIYYSGTGAKAYQTEEDFNSKGIRLIYSDFQPKPYPQLWSNEFIANVSIIDYLMNCGYDWNNYIQNYRGIA